MKAFVKEVLITLVLAAIIFVAARMTIQTFEVEMSSMEPNFYDGQRVVVNKAAYFFGEPKRGDVIVFREPNGTNDDFIKRVIGLPGDTVEVKGGYVYVDGVKLDEPYIMEPFQYDMAPRSNDSEDGWLLPRDNIIGKAWLSTWPPGLWGAIPNYHLDEQIAAAEDAS